MKIPLDNGQEFYVNKTTESNMKILKDATLHKNFDTILIVDGRVGAGKSTLAMQLALYFDATFNLDRVAWTGQQFEQLVINAQKYQAVVFDEAVEGLSSREFYSYINRTLIKLLTKIRHKSLFIIIVLPSFFDLEKGLAIYRSSMLFHCYLDRMRRGQYSVFSYDKKKDLFVYGKRFMNYQAAKASFLADFTKFFPFDYMEYERRKTASYTDRPEKKHKEDILGSRREEFIGSVLQNLKKEGYSTEQLVRLGNEVYTARSIQDLMQKSKDLLGKVGFKHAE